jgi:predicted SAM-dependent methyltransferase
MRLNLGCGKQYKEGFINIDAYDATVADSIMAVENLTFPSNTIDAIEAHQLIEHLGYIHTIYALSEWFRVLKPRGTLLIETPDLESSIKQYLHGNHEVKKETLTWIYGVESTGMEHRLCYPTILLVTLLKKSGFTEIKTSSYTKEKHHPVMRITCRKQHDAVHHLIAHYRKKLMQHHLVHFENSPLALEQETLINLFLKRLRKYREHPNEKILEQCLIDGCIRSVPMTQVFFQECHRQKLMPRDIAKKYRELLHFLSSIQFSNLLVSVLKEMPTTPGTQKKTLQVVTQFTTLSIKKLVSGGKQTEAQKKILTTLSQKSPQKDIQFFSETILEYQAADLCYEAIKAFIKKDYPTASAKWHEAIRLDRNHLLYYWNLGRVLMISKQIPEAKQFYTDALLLIQLAPAYQRKKLTTALKRERDHFSAKNHGTPLLDVNL